MSTRVWTNNELNVTLYRIKHVLYWTYLEAKFNYKGNNNIPEFDVCLNGITNYEIYDAYWIQYIRETEEWFSVLKLKPEFQNITIKLNKKQILLLEEVEKLIYIDKKFEYELRPKMFVFNFIVYAIVTILSQKKYNALILPRATWDRHALLTEMVDIISRFYIYKYKVFSTELKRNWLICMLTIVDALVECEILTREIIQNTGFEIGGILTTVENLNNEKINLPKIENKKRQNKKYRTIYLYQLKIDCFINFSSWNWNFSLIPYQSIILPEQIIYLKAITFYSINKVTLENKYSEKHFWLEDLNILDKLKQLSCYINQNLYELILNEILKITAYNNPDQLLKRIKDDLQLLSKPCFDIPAEKNEDTKNNFKWKINWKKTKERNKKLQKNISKHLIFLDFFLIKNWDYLYKNPIYFVTTFDFRGRIYLKSRISPQASHIFRYIYDYGVLEDTETYAENILPIDYNKWYNFIKYKLNSKICLNLKNQRLLFWLILELAKLVKGQVIEKYQGKITISQFIDLGIDTYLQVFEPILDFEKRVQQNYIIHIINQLLNMGVLKRNYIIYKDATASAIQILTLLLQPANLEIMVYANLNSNDCWYDTYYYIISKYINNYEINFESRPFFTRDFLKKTIMTYNYAATLYTCWNEFKELVKNNTINKDSNFWLELKKDFDNFYRFLDKLFNEQTLFVDSINQQAKKMLATYTIDKEIVLKSNDKSKIYFHYFVTKNQRLTVKLEKTRKTLQISSLSNKLDVKKTTQAIKPNTTHALDATLVRETLRDLDKPIVTIHDCFGAGILVIDKLIFSLNKNISRIYVHTTHSVQPKPISCFSIFIVL